MDADTIEEIDDMDEGLSVKIVDRKPTVKSTKQQGFDFEAFKTAITDGNRQYISDLLLNASKERVVPIETLFMDWKDNKHYDYTTTKGEQR